MTKFKAGDKVRIKPDEAMSSAGSDFNLDYDEIYKIKNASPFDVEIEGRRLKYSSKRFELVQPAAASDELEQLVAKANEGLNAFRRLREIDINALELVYDNGDVDPCRPIDNCLKEIRIKPKPAFAPFTTSNGWEVRMVGDRLSIGCKSFAASELRESLDKLLKFDYTSVNSGYNNQFDATRSGVRYTSNEDMKYVLPWADAERIYEELRKEGV